jgi:replicative DNA helicase
MKRLEENILSYLLENQKKIGEASEVINAQCFTDYKNETLFNAFLDLFNHSTNIDYYSLYKSGLNVPENHFFGLSNYIQTTDENFLEHLDLLKSIGIRKQFTEILTKAPLKLNETISETEAINEVVKELSELHTFGTNKQQETIETHLNTIKHKIKEAMVGRYSGLQIGIDEVDKIYTFDLSDLVLIGARPAMGKTAFAMSIYNYAQHKGLKPLFVSLEMSVEQLLLRLLSEKLQTQSWRMKQGVCDLEQYDMVANEIKESNLLMVDNCFKLDEIEAVINKHYNLGSKLVVIDYLGLINPPKAQSREQEVSQTTRRLKMLAKKLNITIVLLSQLSRAVEQRSNKRPMLSDLRDSGGIEQDADSVLFLYRDEYYGIFENDYGSTIDKAEVIIAKNRHGAVGTANVTFIKDFTSFPNKLNKQQSILDTYEQSNNYRIESPNLDF